MTFRPVKPRYPKPGTTPRRPSVLRPKGRGRDPREWRAHLADIVRGVLALHAEGLSQAEIGARLKVSQSTACRILAGRWRDLAPAPA